jgi:hypothetical protein
MVRNAEMLAEWLRIHVPQFEVAVPGGTPALEEIIRKFYLHLSYSVIGRHKGDQEDLELGSKRRKLAATTTTTDPSGQVNSLSVWGLQPPMATALFRAFDMSRTTTAPSSTTEDVQDPFDIESIGDQRGFLDQGGCSSWITGINQPKP